MINNGINNETEVKDVKKVNTSTFNEAREELVKECMLTTIDNPFDPFEQFNEWFMFDIEKGYYTCSKLARVTNITDDMSSVEVEMENERAIDDFIKYDFLDIYKKVYRNQANADRTTSIND